MNHIEFIDEHGSFCLKQPENISYLYFPLASETGLKSAVTPNFGGDSKIDQETFLLEPVSAENLHNNRSTHPPRAVYEQYPGCPAFSRADGKEAMGAFRFAPAVLSFPTTIMAGAGGDGEICGRTACRCF